MAFRLCILASVAVLLTLLPAASFGSRLENREDGELADLLKQLLETVEHKDKAAESHHRHHHHIHDNVPESRSFEGRLVLDANFPQTRTGPGLTADQKTALVSAMNDYRRLVQAADMYKLSWDGKLAELAQQWSDSCNPNHGHYMYEASEYGFNDVGQNNWFDSNDLAPDAVIRDWASEKDRFNYDTNTCTPKSACDRYRQLVWANTTAVGCGLSRCPNFDQGYDMNVLVCYFGPKNMYDNERPYSKSSAPCTKCGRGQFYCDNDLCDATCVKPGPNCADCRADCKYCGTQTSDCRCQCKKGTIGVDCSGLCSDVLTTATCKKLWSPTTCPKNIDWLNRLCAKYCKVCVTVDDPCTQ